MESIKLNTRLGNCTLKISAQVQNDKIEKLAGFALQYLIWHVVPAEAYNKTSDFKRDALYSDGLAKHVAGATKSVLADFFSNVEIKTAKYDKPDKITKLIKEFISMGMDEASAKAMAESVQAKLASKPETTVEA